jgi:glycosyltransferase involved in cell wall biosynthesis
MSFSVSVLIPTYNYGDKIIYAINSVLNQSYPQSLIEIIVVDDGSTDNTRIVLDNLIKNKSILYFYQSNKGKAAATFQALKLSSGNIIFCLDADDIFFSEKIQETVKIYVKNPNVVHVSTPALIKYLNGHSLLENLPKFLLDRPLKGSFVLNYFFSNNMLYGGGSTFSCLASVIKNENFPDSINMYIDELLIIIALSKGETYFISEPLSIWYVHQKNFSVSNDKDSKIFLKNKQLLYSSNALLSYLNHINVDFNFKKLYFLKHQIRLIYFAELENRKSLILIFQFILNCFIKKRYSCSTHLKYSSFNRLIPTNLIRFLKQIRAK